MTDQTRKRGNAETRKQDAPLDRRWLFVIFLIALALRAGWGVYSLSRSADPSKLEFPDEVQYWEMGRALRAGEGLRDELGFRATRMPLYPAVLATMPDGPTGIIAAKALHWIAGAGAAVLAAGLSGAVFGRRAPWLAGLWVAFDPFLIFFSSLLLTETFFVTALTGLFWWTWRVTDPARGTAVTLRSVVVAGLLAALCVHIRESSLLLIFLLAGCMCVRLSSRRLRCLGPALVLLIVVVALLPWAYRNHRILGEWCFTTTRFGISLYDGVRPGAKGDSDLGSIKAAPEVAGLSEAEWDRWFVDRSWEAIRSEPGRVLRLAGVKLARMWNPVPNVDAYQSASVRMISLIWTLPAFALAAVGAILWPMRRGKEGVLRVVFLLLPAIYLSLVHSVFVGSVRYRLGAMPMIEVLAAATLVAMFDRIRGRESHAIDRPS